PLYTDDLSRPAAWNPVRHYLHSRTDVFLRPEHSHGARSRPDQLGLRIHARAKYRTRRRRKRVVRLERDSRLAERSRTRQQALVQVRPPRGSHYLFKNGTAKAGLA